MTETVAVERGYGAENMTAPLRRVMVRALRPVDVPEWEAYGWRAEPDPAGAQREHEAFRQILADAGAEVILAEADHAPDPDAIYMYDPALVTGRGAVLLNPGKAGRRCEVEPMGRDLEAAGVPVVGRMSGAATAEGGDTLWLDERTLLVGHSYRTNGPGIAALRDMLPDVDVIPFDLPHWKGRDFVLHFMSFISPLAPDLAVVYPPLMPVRLVELLVERNIRTVEVPDEEFESMGPNVLALAPGVVIALDGNHETRRRMERAGVEVHVYTGNEISLKGDGGPTCLTRPILRG